LELPICLIVAFFLAVSTRVKVVESEADHWGDLGVDGWIILGWISRRWDVGMWAGLGWPKIETGGVGL